MPYTADELVWLEGGIANPIESSLEMEPPEENGGIIRTGKQILNIIPKSLNVVGRKLGEASQFFNPEMDLSEGTQQAANFLPTFETGPNQGFKDVLLGDILPEIPATVAEYMIPYSGAAKAAKAIGGAGRLSSIVAEGLGQGVANAATLPRLDDTVAAVARGSGDGGVTLADYVKPTDVSATDAGLFGFASGALQEALPRSQRALPLAAASGLYYAKTGDALVAIGNVVGNMFPKAFQAENLENITTPRLNPSKFDNILNEAEGIPPIASRQNTGEFAFVDQIPNTTQAPLNATGDLFNQVPEMRLDRSPSQLNLSLEQSTSPSGLSRGYELDPLQSPVESIQPKPSGLMLEGQQYTQQPLSPLLELQSQRATPDPFRSLDDVLGLKPQQFPDQTGDLLNYKPEVKPSSFIAHPQEQLNPELQNLLKQSEMGGPGSTKGTQQGDAKIFASKLKTQKEVDLIQGGYDDLTHKMSQIEDMDVLMELSNKLRFLNETLHYARGDEGYVQSFLKSDPNYKPTVPGEWYRKTFNTTETRIQPVLSPAIWDVLDREIYNTGKAGVDTHAKLKEGDAFENMVTKGVNKRKTVDDPDPFFVGMEKTDVEHGFIDENGKQLSRIEAGKYAIENNLLNENGLAKAELAKKQGKPFSLDSQDLKAAEFKPNLEAAKSIENDISVIQKQATDAKEAGQFHYAATLEKDLEVLTQKGVETIEGSLMQRSKNQAGGITPETAAILGAGGIGALIAYKESEGDIGTTLAAGILAAGLGLGGIKAAQALRNTTGPKTTPATATKPRIPNETIEEKVKQFAKETSRTPGGFAVMGRGGVWANAVRFAEGMTGLNVSEIFRDKKILAEGFISDQLEVLQHAVDSVKGIKPSAGFSDATARFLRGQLADKVDVENTIRAGGGLTGDAWNKLPTRQKAAFPEKWMVLDDPKNTNTSGSGVTVYHVTNQTKNQLNNLQQQALRAQVTNAGDGEFMKLALQARTTIDNLMGVVHKAVPPGERLNKILGTMGQYMSRSHDILTDPKYYPTDVEIGAAMDRLATIKEDRFVDSLPLNAGSGATINSRGKTYTVSPQAADEFNNLHTPEELRSLVGQYIQEIKQIAASNKLGILSKDTEQLGSSIFTGRKELDEVTQVLLGTHKAPLEMIQQTVNRLIPSARAGHFMKDLLQLTDEATGLKMSYGSALEYNKAINSIKDALSQATDPRIIQDLDNRLKEISSYVPISGQQPKMGLFQGAYVSRAAHDQLAGFNNPFGLLDNSIGRGLASFNQLIKETHLVANPIVHTRNMLQIPFFLAMGNAAASPAAWKSAYEAMKNPLSFIGRRLTQNGVFIGNVVQGEFKHSLQELLDGTADKTIWNVLKKGREAAQKLYAAPDNFVRAATYLAAEQRAAKKFGVSVDVADPRVMQEARAFMSRRTMDYANVPQWVKTGRQVPFVSMFLSYTHEIMRISKNLAADAFKGDLQAGATLAGMSSIPFLLQMNAENQLKEKDLKDWNKLKNVSQDYSRPRFKLPMSRNKNGTFNYIDITPLFPFSDFQLMARSAAKGDLESVAAVNPFVGLEKTPLLSMLSEQITGKERHTAKEYRDGWDRTMSVARQLVPPHTPGIGTEYAKSAPQWAGGKLEQTNLKTGRTNTIKGALLRHSTGIDYTQVNPDIATSNAIKSAQHDIANEKQYLRDVLLTSGISPEAKKRAEKRYVEAVHHIREQLESRINRN